MGFIGNATVILSGAMLMLGSSALANDKRSPVVSSENERLRVLVESGAIKGLTDCPDDRFIQCAGMLEERKLAVEERYKAFDRQTPTLAEFPKSLVGRWETEIRNCDRADPHLSGNVRTGSVAEFSNDGGPRMFHYYYGTEPTYCSPETETETVTEDGAAIRVRGGCSIEESDADADDGYRIELSVAGDFIILSYRPGSEPGEKLYRCDKGEDPSAKMTTLDMAAVQGRPKTCSAGPDKTLWKSADGTVIAYRPIDDTPTIGTMIFEGWKGSVPQWRATTKYGCSNGISACYVTVPMARADDITAQVLAIEENGEYPYLAMPELWHRLARVQFNHPENPSVKAGWLNSRNSRQDRPEIQIPSYMRAAGCVRDRRAYD